MKGVIVIKIVLGVIILALAFLLARSIIQPIRFNREAEARSEAVKARLLEVREAQTAYKSIFGNYASSFDTLLHFIENDSFEIRKITGSYAPDEMNEVEALDAGLVSVSKTLVSVRDSLFNDAENYKNLRYVPGLEGVGFEMNAGNILTGSRVEVDVFEVYVLYEDLLWDLDQQLVNNYIIEKSRSSGFPGLKMGSMTEAVITGNWE